jgi:hypothetical protein
MLDVFLVLVVVSNQGIEFLGSCGSLLDKEKENGIGETKWVWRGGWDHGEKRVSNDRYHYDQGEMGDPKG